MLTRAYLQVIRRQQEYQRRRQHCRTPETGLAEAMRYVRSVFHLLDPEDRAKAVDLVAAAGDGIVGIRIDGITTGDRERLGR